MAKERIQATDLGLYLDKHLVEKIEVYFKTGIILSKLSKLCNSQADLHADDFYLIALASEADIDSMADFVFKDYTVKKITGLQLPNGKNSQVLSKFGEFVQEFLTSQKLIAAKIGIDEGRISKLMKASSAKRPLAVEVYLTAKVFNQSPQRAFAKVCGHLTLNGIEEQERLRLLDLSKKAHAKKKRQGE
jgi:transcriptional regulator with XRE-family HTH domain